MEILKYENFKKEVKENYPIRKNVTLMGLNINFEDSESRNGSVSIDGVRLRLSSNAFKTLLKTLNITDTFMGKFTDIFGMNSRNQLIKIIKKYKLYEYDKINNLYSKYTLLIYLNDDYEGGTTTFYTDTFIERFKVQPKKGRILCFDIDLFRSGDRVSNGNKMWIGTELVCKKIFN
jgi:hypothetical protein